MIPSPRLKGAISTLERAKRPILVTHQRPDGDAVGSALGLGLLLEMLGAKVQLACADPVPERYRYLQGSDRFTTEPDFRDADLLVMLDCPKDEMSALDIGQVLKRMPVVDIDHHPKAAPPRDRRLAMYDASDVASTAEIVVILAREAGWRIGRPAATALLTGIVTDTSAFINSTTTADTYRAASVLLRQGADLKAIIQHCFYHSSVPKLRLWGRAMSRIERVQASGVVSTVLTAEDLEECGAEREDIEGLVNFLNTIPGVPALMLLTDLGTGEIKGSFRTRNESIDVNKLANVLGGGGHRQAAGFTVPGRLTKNANETWSVLPPA